MAMLTTVDNPFNPYDDFVKWYDYDTTVLKYNSCAYLSRTIDLLCENPKIKKRLDMLGDYGDNFVNDLAIDEIIKYDPFKIYKRIEKDKESVAQTEQEDE